MNHDVMDYLASHRDRFREMFSDLMRKKKELFAMESVVFHNDISTQYEERIKSRITSEICSRLALDYETVYLVVEEMNVDEYLVVPALVNG